MDEPNAGPEKHTTYREAVATRHMGSQSQQLPRLPLRLVVGLSEMLFFFNDCAVCLAGSQFPNQGLNPGHGSESQEL